MEGRRSNPLVRELTVYISCVCCAMSLLMERWLPKTSGWSAWVHYIGVNMPLLLSMDQVMPRRSQIFIMQASHTWWRMGCLNNACVNDMTSHMGGHGHDNGCHVNCTGKSNVSLVVLYIPVTKFRYTALTVVSSDLKAFKNRVQKKWITFFLKKQLFNFLF